MNKLGLDFKMSDVNANHIIVFNEAVDGIRKSISESGDISMFTGKSLNITGRLLQLGIIKAATNNPTLASTFFNISGDPTQSYIGTNPASDLYHFVSQLSELTTESLEGTGYEYLLTDDFAKNSILLKRLFDSKGNRRDIKGNEGLFQVGYVGGIENQSKGKNKKSANLIIKKD